jgi:GNAT superfamily N-acetyltransferase
MGQALGEWVSSPTMVHEVGPSAWMLLSGAPSAYLNLALIHRDDPAALDRITDAVAFLKCPAVLMFAGSAKPFAPGSGLGWSRAGTMTFMTISTQAAPWRLDDRVRRADEDDADVVTCMLADAFGVRPDIAALMTAHLRRPGDAMKTWLLEDGGEPVCTATTCRVDDAVTIWSMATPGRFTRRGYGRALLADLLAQAAAEHIPTGLLGATAAGRPLYEATGWSTLEEWDIYLGVEPSSSPPG